MAAEAALALVNIEVGQYYWLPWDTPRAVILMGVPWQPVVQPHLRVHHGQGRLGHAGGWISGNQGEPQGAVRPTYVVKISWLFLTLRIFNSNISFPSNFGYQCRIVMVWNIID